MKTALVLGGGDTLLGDIRRLHERGHHYDKVFACNDAGAIWRGPLEGWVSLHPEKFDQWTKKRRENGLEEEFGPAKQLWAHRVHKQDQNPLDIKVATICFPGQKTTGSSGLFAAKVAMVNCGFDRVIFCGVPMNVSPHFFDKKDWKSATGFRRQWHHVDKDYLRRMRSMSGWSYVLLGSPDDWRCEDG